MDLTIEINGKKYNFVDKVNIDGKDYIAYEDENTVYINAYEMKDNNLIILEITEDEKQEVLGKLNICNSIE